MTKRVRRVGAAALGVSMLVVATWIGARMVDAADAGGDFRLVRDAGDGPVIADPASRTWSARVEPRELASRVRIMVDGRVVAEGEDPTLDMSTLAPGIHIIETELERRGQRRERIVDHVLVGPFDPRWKAEPKCGLGLVVSERAIERMLLPELEKQLLSGLQSSPLMGPETIIDELEVSLANDTVQFQVEIQGRNRVEVEGWLRIERAGDRNLAVRLALLGDTDFSGETRDRAVGAGAAVGAVVTGPLAPAGAMAGSYFVNRYLDRKSRDVIRGEIEAGLRKAKQIELFPAEVELLPGRPTSRVALSFCEDPTLMPHAVGAKLAVRPVAPTDSSVTTGTQRTPSAAPGPVSFGIELPPPAIAPERDVEISVSVDALNALLDAWTAQGLLSELLGESNLVPATNEQLTAWTTVSVARVGLGLPPVLAPAAPSAQTSATEADLGWPIAMAGVELGLNGAGAKPGQDLQVAGRGVVRPHWDDERGVLLLTGGLEDLAIGCRESTPDGEVLHPCFAALLELGDFVPKINDRLRPGASKLPAIDLRAVVEQRTAGSFTVDDVKLHQDPAFPGVVSLSAKL